MPELLTKDTFLMSAITLAPASKSRDLNEDSTSWIVHVSMRSGNCKRSGEKESMARSCVGSKRFHETASKPRENRSGFEFVVRTVSNSSAPRRISPCTGPIFATGRFSGFEIRVHAPSRQTRFSSSFLPATHIASPGNPHRHAMKRPAKSPTGRAAMVFPACRRTDELPLIWLPLISQDSHPARVSYRRRFHMDELATGKTSGKFRCQRLPYSGFSAGPLHRNPYRHQLLSSSRQTSSSSHAVDEPKPEAGRTRFTPPSNIESLHP
jgi:hypothetical protein